MQGIRIKARKAGFRRAGLAHAAEWVSYPLDRFTEEQLRQIATEPMLATEPVELSDTTIAEGKAPAQTETGQGLSSGSPAGAGDARPASPDQVPSGSAAEPVGDAASASREEAAGRKPAGNHAPQPSSTNAGAEEAAVASAPAAASADGKKPAAKPKAKGK